VRYSQLNDLLKQRKPTSVLEVGTWNGDRAIQMMAAAKAFVYFGFDLFDGATEDDDEREFNVKPHFSAEDVRARLPFPNKLYKGYSRYTLPIFLDQHGPGRVDFAYIDGGHSIETIQTDYDYVRKIVKPGGLIVFDDYYVEAPPERLENIGANKILEGIGDFTLLPDIDPVVEGFGVQLAYVHN
jgi:predicted O-methyltransferase YrrM